MALAGAGSIAATLGSVPALARRNVPWPPERNKLVFISDLHLNLQTPYAWLVKHAGYLADFLDALNQRPDVAELIILGDMLDDWVAPVDAIPQTFGQVLDANMSNGIVPALQQICQNPDIKLTYVTGNHDMLSFLSENKQVVEDNLPGIAILSDAPGLGAYARDGIIWAEHGHRYTLFNAPDIWSRPQGHLPMGYFISRLAASKSLDEHRLFTSPEVLDLFFNSPDQVQEYLQQAGAEPDEGLGGVIDDALIIAVFNAIALWSGNWPWTPFDMNGLDGFADNPIVEEIAIEYATIFSGWPYRQNIVDHYLAVINELGHLAGAANLLFEMPSRIRKLYPFTPRIVLFGHTHEAAFQFHSGDTQTIYANTGTWVDDKPDMTWVEIEKTQAKGLTNYSVSLWFLGEDAARQEATISV